MRRFFASKPTTGLWILSERDRNAQLDSAYGTAYTTPSVAAYSLCSTTQGADVIGPVATAHR